MAKYVISYDLVTPGRDYARLYAELERLKCRRVLWSQWVGNITANSAQIRDHLVGFIDTTDRLLVTSLETPNDWAGWNLMTRVDQL